jgi:hypothetical protein
VKTKDMTCPLCRAQPEESCRSQQHGRAKGRILRQSHAERIDAAEAASGR